MTQTEHVRYHLQDGLLLIEGTGKDSAGAVVFDARGHLMVPGARLRSARVDARRPHRREPVEVRDGGFTWSIPLSGTSRMRHTMNLTPDGEWHEVGGYSPDGERWMRVVDMRLRKIVP